MSSYSYEFTPPPPPHGGLFGIWWYIFRQDRTSLKFAEIQRNLKIRKKKKIKSV